MIALSDTFSCAFPAAFASPNGKGLPDPQTRVSLSPLRGMERLVGLIFLLLTEADVGELTTAVELALFYNSKLDLTVKG
jgi:hypothetical protein